MDPEFSYRFLPRSIRVFIKYQRARVHAKLFPLLGIINWQTMQLRLASSDDFKLLKVDPNNITHCIIPGLVIPRFIMEGDWDVNDAVPISQGRSKEHDAIHDIFIHNVPYTETDQYHEMKEAVKLYQTGETTHPASLGAYWCRDEEDIDEYFRILFRAYQSIKTEGYKEQGEIAHERPDESHGPTDEIQVLIGRSGDLILGNGGSHRTVIAQILNIDNVCVRVIGMHKKLLDERTQRTRNVRKAIQEILHGLESTQKAVEKV